MSEEIKDVESSVTAEETASEAAPAAAPSAAPQREQQRRGGDRFRQSGSDDDRKEGKMSRSPRFKKKVCKFCHNKDITIDYKNSELLEKFLTERGKILPRRITGTCAKHQRHIAIEVKRARMIALLPFIEQ